MTMVVVPFCKSILLLIIPILIFIFLHTFIFEINQFLFGTLMYKFWIMFRWFSFNLLGFSRLIVRLSGRIMSLVFSKFFFRIILIITYVLSSKQLATFYTKPLTSLISSVSNSTEENINKVQWSNQQHRPKTLTMTFFSPTKVRRWHPYQGFMKNRNSCAGISNIVWISHSNTNS